MPVFGAPFDRQGQLNRLFRRSTSGLVQGRSEAVRSVTLPTPTRTSSSPSSVGRGWRPAPDPQFKINGYPVGYNVFTDGNRYALDNEGTVTWQCSLIITSVAGVGFPPSGQAQFTVNHLPVPTGGVAEAQGVPCGVGIYGGAGSGNGSWPVVAQVFTGLVTFLTLTNPSDTLLTAGGPSQPANRPAVGDSLYWTVTYEGA